VIPHVLRDARGLVDLVVRVQDGVYTDEIISHRHQFGLFLS
jgi:hypothetical protein